MSTDRDVTRIVRSWLHEDAYEDADRILNLVLDEIDTTPQRRAGWLARRFPPMNSTALRLGIAAVVAALAVILGINYFSGANTGGPPDAPPSAAPSASAPARLNLLPTGDLAPGTYEIDEVFPVRLTFTVPTGFGHGRGESDGVGIQGNPGGRGIEFQIASNAYPDPCHSTSVGPANPPIGATVDDLVTAMTTLVGFQAGPVTDITIGGLPARAFDLTNEIDQTTCDAESLKTFVFANGTSSGVGTGERQRIYVMDVQGTRLMIMTYYFSNETGSNDASDAATMAAIVQSISFP
jgi:hypothetical protein